MYSHICNNNILSSYCKRFESALFAQADSELLVAELWLLYVCVSTMRCRRGCVGKGSLLKAQVSCS